MILKNIFLYVACLCVCSASSALEIKSIEELIPAFESRSPELRSQNELLKISDRNADAAFGALLPNVDLSTSLEKNHDDTTVNDGRSSVGSLALTANLYRSHLDWHNYKIAKDQEEIAKYQYMKASGSALLGVIAAYLDYSVKYVALDIANEGQRLVNEQFTKSKKSLRAGTGTKLDFLRFESRRISAEFDVQQAEAALIQARNTLRSYFTLKDEDLTFKPLIFGSDFVPTLLKADLDTKNHFEYKMEERQLEISELEVAKARRNYWPKLDLTTRWSRGVSGFWGDGATENWDTDFATTLSLTFNLFDGGILAAQVANRKSEQIIQENRIEATELNLRARLSNLQQDHARLIKQVQAALVVLKIESQVYLSISREYRVGNITYLDFIDSLNKLLSARQNLQSSAAEYMKSIYFIRYNRGDLYEVRK